jgi:hypothetical protein
MRGKKRREWAHGTGRADAGLSGRLTRGKKHDEDLVCYKQFGFDGLVFFFLRDGCFLLGRPLLPTRPAHSHGPNQTPDPHRTSLSSSPSPPNSINSSLLLADHSPPHRRRRPADHPPHSRIDPKLALGYPPARLPGSPPARLDSRRGWLLRALSHPSPL